MIKRVKLISIALLLVGVSCARTEIRQPEQEDLVTIRANFPQDTRGAASITTGISWSWSADDILTIIGDNTETYAIKEGFTPKEAQFVGKVVKGSKFSIAYPSLDPVDWSVQSQKGNNSADQLRYVAVLDDVDSYTTFTYSPEWAQNHGGSLRQTGVFKFLFTFPNSVTTVTSIVLSAPSPVFYAGNDDSLTDKLTLNLKDITLVPGQTLIGWMTTSWNHAQIPAGTVLNVAVTTDRELLSRDVTLVEGATIKSGVVNTFTLTAEGWPGGEVIDRYAGGSGTAADPWIITNSEHMGHIKGDIVAGETRYFKLGADIDMTGVEWEPLNYEEPYNKRIEFDGDGYTISNLSCSAETYPGLFGVLYGKCVNLNIRKASITTKSSTAGILGGYGGTGGKPCEVRNVHVQGVIKSDRSSVGGLFGSAREATITACSADIDIQSNTSRSGGIIGYDPGLVTIRDCYSTGSIVTDTQLAGGICGELITEGSSVYNCYSSATVVAQFYAGGIVGRANKNAKGNKDNNESVQPNNHIEKCIAWNNRIESNATDGNEHYSNGAIVGSTAIKNYLADCYRRADLVFINCPKNEAYVLTDQENASPSNPLVKGTGTYNYAYNGKAAPSGATCSSVAQSLGWSADIWDFSGALPKHKTSGETPGDQSATGQLPDFEISVFFE